MSKNHCKSRVENCKKSKCVKEGDYFDQKKQEVTDIGENLKNINDFMKKFNEMMTKKNSNQISYGMGSQQSFLQFQERKRPQVSSKIKQKTQPCYLSSNNNQFSYQKLITEVDQDYIDHILDKQDANILPSTTLNCKDNFFKQITINKRTEYKNKLSTVMQESVSELLTTPRDNFSNQYAENSQVNSYAMSQWNQEKVVCIQPIEILNNQDQFQQKRVIDLKITKIDNLDKKRIKGNSFKKILSMKQNMRRQQLKQEFINQQISQHSAQFMSGKVMKIKSKLKMNSAKQAMHHSPNKDHSRQNFECLSIKGPIITSSQQNTAAFHDQITKKYSSANSYVDSIDNIPNRSKSRKRIFLKQCVCKRRVDMNILTQTNNQSENNESIQTLRNKSQQGKKRKSGISLTKTKNSLANICLNTSIGRQQSGQKIRQLRPIQSQARKSLQRKSLQKSDPNIISSLMQQQLKIKAPHKNCAKNSVSGFKTVASIEIISIQNAKNQKIVKQTKQEQIGNIKKQFIYPKFKVDNRNMNTRMERTKIKSNKQNIKRTGPRQVKINIDCQNLIASMKINKSNAI